MSTIWKKVAIFAIAAVVIAAVTFAAVTLLRVGGPGHAGRQTEGGAGNDARVRQIESHGERVPDLAAPYTVVNIRNGSWSAPGTWDRGRVPVHGDTVRIAEGSRVVYDVASDARLHAVGVAGTLAFRTSVNTSLSVTHLLVYAGGTLTVGEEGTPVEPDVTAEIIINDRPLQTGIAAAPGVDPFQYGNGLLVWGTLSLFGDRREPTFERLARQPAQGDTELVLAAVPDGWRTGDEILLPDSHLVAPGEVQRVDQSPYNLEGSLGIVARPRWEIAKIADVNGARVSLARPLRFAHPTARDRTGEIARSLDGIPLVPHVANITRNVVVRSANPDGVRGHTIAFRGASVVLAHTSLIGLGRTTVAPLNNTQGDPAGRVTHIGENQVARYPVHMHHVVDAASVHDAEVPFQIVGAVVAGARRWGISIHASHFGLIKDTVVFDVDGAGIVTEDGSETGNRFDHNLVAGVHGSGLAVDARHPSEGVGHEGAGFWFGSDNNIVVNNVAAGVRDAGFTLFRMPGAIPFPSFPFRAEGAGDAPFRVFEFSGNEAYGAVETGVELWDSKECPLCESRDAVLEDTTVWHSRRGVRFDYHADHYAMEDLLVHGDPARLDGTTGVTANASARALIRRADVRYVEVGLDGGGHRNRVIEVDDASILARVGIRIRRGNSWNQRAAVFRDVAVTSLAGPRVKLIELDARPVTGGGNVMIHRPIYFIAFQRRPGDDFQLFFDDQAPGHPVPQDDNPARGCPEAGLTNAQCMSAHGIATGGELASCTNRVDGIDGFACPTDLDRLINR